MICWMNPIMKARDHCVISDRDDGATVIVRMSTSVHFFGVSHMICPWHQLCTAVGWSSGGIVKTVMWLSVEDRLSSLGILEWSVSVIKF